MAETPTTTGHSYLKTRKPELDAHGRIAEIVSEIQSDVTIALVYEANSKVARRIAGLEAEITRLKTEAKKIRRKAVAEAIAEVSKVSEPLGPIPDRIRLLFEDRGLEWVVRETTRLTKAEAIDNIDKIKES